MSETKKIEYTDEPWQIDDDEGEMSRNFIYGGLTGQPICTVAMFDSRDYEDYIRGIKERPEYDSAKFNECEGNSFILLNALRMYKILKKVQGRTRIGKEVNNEISMVLNSIENHIDDGMKIKPPKGETKKTELKKDDDWDDDDEYIDYCDI